MVAVVIPTIAGREALLERTLAAYRESEIDHEMQFVVVRARPTIGRAWNDGAERALEAGADFVHLTADDMLPEPGSLEIGVDDVESGEYPSPRLLNADGTLHSCGTMGGGMLLGECASGTVCVSSPVPTLSAALWRECAPLPDLHYYADDLLAQRARQAGAEVVVDRRYQFTHLEGLEGRHAVVARSGSDRAGFLRAVADNQPVPA